MSDTAVERGPEPCAFAVVAMRTSPADMTNPVNKFIDRRSSHAPAPRASCSLSRAGISLQNPADLGPDRGAFASNRGRGDLRVVKGQYSRCRRLSRACVIEKNLAWWALGQ